MSSLPFGGGTLDRAEELRSDPVSLAALPARAVVAGPAGVGLDGDRRALARISAEPRPEVLLGIEQGRALYGVWREDPSLTSLREVGVNLPAAESGLAAYAWSLLSWHQSHPFCHFCGGRTAVTAAGLARACERCGRHHFPRTDPVVIMAVEHGDRLLLGRRTGSPANRYSVLAGFVGPGETAEQAVAREVAEEARIEVVESRYIASQPWPFPSSLMLGFLATARDGTPVVGDGELEDVRWVPRDEVARAAAGEGLLELPGAVSIARRLVDLWLAG